MLEIILGVLALLLALGVGFTKMIPGIFVKGVGILAAVVVTILFWQTLSLPAVEIADKLVSMAWAISMALGYAAGVLITTVKEG